MTVKAIPGGNYAFQDVTVYFTINKAVLTVTGAQAAARPYDGTAVVAMTGGTRAHETVQVNLLIALGNRLRAARAAPTAAT